MDSFNNAELRELFLSLPSVRHSWENLLGDADLVVDDMPEYAVGAFDHDDNLIGTASLNGNIIKYVTIDSAHRGEAIANSLISNIISIAGSRGIFDLCIYTKPEYASLFSDLSFHIIGQSDTSIMLENSLSTLRGYKDYLKSKAAEIKALDPSTGIIVMNANPLTIGHLYLIRQSASKVDHLFIIPLADNPNTFFSYQSRRHALENATRDMENVTVLEGSRYCISQATFPSYFIKELNRRTDSYIKLDLDIFCNHIAPSLGATIRFVGEEPIDRLTARYNELMKELLPAKGIKTIEIPRLRDREDVIISASLIRKTLQDGHTGTIFRNIPVATYPLLLAKATSAALLKELQLTPKPGLIDMNNSGAHADMDFSIMERSIRTIEPFFEELAEASMTEELPTADILQPIGIRAENKMFEATGGVNTHRGALFSLGLTVSAAAYLLYNMARIEESGDFMPVLDSSMMSRIISEIASTFSRPDSTNGATVHKHLAVPTALDMAQTGYKRLFNKWLKETYPHLRMLAIMKDLEDSNIYHRGGRAGADFVHEISNSLYNEFTGSDNEIELIRALEEIDSEFTKRNLSPGGSADMLALSFLLDTILPSSGSLATEFPTDKKL